MTKQKYFIPAAALAVAALTLTACGTPTETVAASSTTVTTAPPSSTTSATDAELAAAAGLPDTGSVDVADAAAAAAAQRPFVFGTGLDCGWLRLPDGSLWALHDTTARTGSSALARDVGTESAFRADPSYEPGRCQPATDIPTVDDPTAPEPYRWTADYGNTYVRWHGKTFIVPGTVYAGMALTPIN